jgi:hypothetical protein
MADDVPAASPPAPQPVIQKYRFDESSLTITVSEFDATEKIGDIQIVIQHSATYGTNVQWTSTTQPGKVGSLNNVPPAKQQVIADFVKSVMRDLGLIN